MQLLGNGVLGVWHSVVPGKERLVDNWYNEEHNAERVAIDGFLRARRYINLRRGRHYFCRYDVTDVSVLGSRAYLSALDNPSERSLAIFPYYRDTLRGVFRLSFRDGFGDGGYVMACRFPLEDSVSADTVAEIGQTLLRQSVMTRAEVWTVDTGMSTITTKEKALRRAVDRFPHTVLVLDGSDPEQMEEALHGISNRAVLEAAEIDICKLVLHLPRSN